MTHEIFGERFLGRDKPAWHILGQVFDLNREITVTDAVVEAGCGYRLEKVQIPDLEAFGKPIGVPLFAVFREPTNDDPEPCYLGTVSEDHELLDNLGIARILDPIGKHWPVETVGALRKGDSFFVTLKIGRSVLNGSDAVDRYFLVNGNHANGKGVRITVSTVLTTVPILNVTTTAVIQTYRSKEGAYTVFLQLVDGDGHLRIVLPDKVCQALYRQRESVVDRSTPDSRARAKAKREREKARKAKEKRRRIASTPFDEEAARRWELGRAGAAPDTDDDAGHR